MTRARCVPKEPLNGKNVLDPEIDRFIFLIGKLTLTPTLTRRHGHSESRRKSSFTIGTRRNPLGLESGQWPILAFPSFKISPLSRL